MNDETDNRVLLVGTSVTDITPPLEVGLLTSSVKGLFEPFESLRLALKARVITMKSGNDTVVIVSLDLLGLNDTSVGGWKKFKQSLSDSIPSENIIITCTHTHNAPESIGLTGLYLTEPYRKWLLEIQYKIKECIQQAQDAAIECKLSIGSTKLDGYSLQRRIRTASGIIMSDSIQPIAQKFLDYEPVDRRVQVIRFHSTTGEIIASIVHAVCHPVNEMCLRYISSDYPGELCIELEASNENGMPMFLNGAAGNINPLTVSMGSKAAYLHGQALANAVEKNYKRYPINSACFEIIHKEIPFLIRSGINKISERDALGRLSVIRIGSLAIVFLPGEPFVETALEIERKSPFTYTLIVGYSENSIGYIPPLDAFKEGGYEVGPGKWSFLEAGSAEILCEESSKLLQIINKSTHVIHEN